MKQGIILSMVLAVLASVLQAKAANDPINLGRIITPRTNYVIQVTWNPVDGAAGYRVYWGTVSGQENNRVECGTSTSTFLKLPLQTCYVVVRAIDSTGVESDPSNRIKYPGDTVITATGTSLQFSPTVNPYVWVSTNSPWCVTNPVGAGFFRSTDPNGPIVVQSKNYDVP